MQSKDEETSRRLEIQYCRRRTHFDIGCHARIPTRNTILRWEASFRITGSTLKKKSPGRNSIALRLSEATVRSRALRLLSLGPFEGAIDMSCNLTGVRSVPGRAFSTTRCRQPDCNETETLGHVLGFCRKGELLRNRHHRVRGAIACLLRNKGWEVHEEVHCISEDDSHRRADIIAINRQQQKAIIIDPTIRMERDLNQLIRLIMKEGHL
ncbi:hypothetical protein ANN_07367 [Periplaneta americana]|uniref:DUF4817 domain-containing protein n=1 Tax=Periplaneta americana TaxID=6978 RepID=A0ABQ8T016_PERAM|nr:hypothetical protein ANN_07367 [Periplaneta americana]